MLEFGTLAGYSTIWFARGVGPEGRVVTLELHDQNAEIVRANFARAQVDRQVEILVGPAADSARRVAQDRVQPMTRVSRASEP